MTCDSHTGGLGTERDQDQVLEANKTKSTKFLYLNKSNKTIMRRRRKLKIMREYFSAPPKLLSPKMFDFTCFLDLSMQHT